MAARTRAESLVLALVVASCTSFAGLDVPRGDGGPSVGDAAIDGGGASTGDGQPAKGYADVVLEDRPVAYWRLDETFGPDVADATSHDHRCIHGKGIAVGRPGAFAGSNALELPGTAEGFVTCGEEPFDFSGTAPMSVEVWIRVSAYDDLYRKVVSKEQRDTSGRRRGYSLTVHDPWGIGFDRFEDDTQICRAELPIQTDRWTHVVATFDGAFVRLFVDGAGAAAPCPQTAMTDRTLPLVIGAQSDGTYGFFRGSVDEVAVYDRPLAPERVMVHLAAARR
jgi:hypothetical protein